jgi:mannose-6-phosphate isomerase-like protein (cupin superfamily)
MGHGYRSGLALAALLLHGAADARDDKTRLAYAINKDCADHYVWGGKNDGWYLVKRKDMTVIQERMVSGGEEVRHYHKKSRQFFYVLSGELVMDADDYSNVIKAGEGIEIEPGKAHQARNPSGAPLEMLVISFPNSHADLVEVETTHQETRLAKAD